MANDLNSAVNALKGILGDNAGDKIQAVVQGLSQSDEQQQESETPAKRNSGIDESTMQYIMRMKSIIDEMSRDGDDRSNLLLSLRPYMREQRQKSIDNALRLMTLTKLSGLFTKL
jgi:glutamate/tyrosine decarboxylase-like PLP-dependent enzyme